MEGAKKAYQRVAEHIPPTMEHSCVQYYALPHIHDEVLGLVLDDEAQSLILLKVVIRTALNSSATHLDQPSVATRTLISVLSSHFVIVKAK